MSTVTSSPHGIGAHILICPYPGPGHIIPLLDFTHQLLTRGLTITVLVTPTTLPLLQPLLSLYPLSLHSLFLSHPDSQNGSLIARLSIYRQLHNPIIQWFRSHPSPPVAIISDFFLSSINHLASDLGVPRLIFSPSGAYAISVFNSLWRDLPKKHDPLNEDFLVSFPRVPNSPVYPWCQLSYIFRSFEKGDPDSEFYRNSVLDNMASWGLVFNSFTELERVYIDHFKKEMGHDHVWAVGPLLPDPVESSTERGGSSAIPSHEVLTWLDQWLDNSVVYVCFGSRTVLTRKQVEVLTAALECSGIKFIWGVKGQVATDYGMILDGFEDRVAKRGFVIKGWTPQVNILRHRAVGVFVTHCGWNSTLEGLSGGTMMLTWPMGRDQFMNATLLVDHLGIGVRIGEGTRNIPDPIELTRLLIESVGGSRAESVRAKKLSDAALGAVKGGSSERELDELVKRLSELKGAG